MRVSCAAAATAVAYAAWRLYRWRPKMRTLRQGIDGERAGDRFLDRLREQGCQVFHDPLGEGFAVDHVLIGPTASPTAIHWSKPRRRPVGCAICRPRAAAAASTRNRWRCALAGSSKRRPARIAQSGCWSPKGCLRC
jgi:hypothetical protein